ncbi:MAG: nuclear transport factor 2 family protein [Gemmatimonadaceae bacterium]|nr:nuclear transport factor 2 family protein [Gemmatimonadaceae bacterium]
MSARISPTLVVVISLASALCAARLEAASADAASDVLKYERAVCAAYERNDAAAIDSLVADGYVLTESNGSLTKKSDDLRDARNQAVRFTAFRNEDMQVTMYGLATAIVRGKTIVQGTAKDGSKVDVVVQFTDTVVRIGGRWKLVAGHVSRLKNS